MTGVVTDIVEGQVGRSADGWQATRVFNIQMRPGGNAAARQYEAALSSGVPQYGDPHPAIPGIRVSNVSVDHDDRIDPLQFDVTVQYSGDTTGTTSGLEGSGVKGIDVQSSTVTATTYLDHKGEQMLVVYRGPEFQTQTTAVSEGGIVSYPYITSSFVYRNFVMDAAYEVPTVSMTVITENQNPSHVASINAAGRTNSSKWSGLGVAKWLCLGIDSSRNQSGTHDWRHQFAVAPQFTQNDTWRFRAEPILRQNSNGTQSYSTQNTLGNGIEFFDLYKPSDFRRLFSFVIPS